MAGVDEDVVGVEVVVVEDELLWFFCVGEELGQKSMRRWARALMAAGELMMACEDVGSSSSESSFSESELGSEGRGLSISQMWSWRRAASQSRLDLKGPRGTSA